MGCLGNSKTTEDQGVDEKERREANKKIEKQLQKERLAYKATHRLLLLGKAGGRAPAPAGVQRTARASVRAGRPGRGPGDCGHLLQPRAGVQLGNACSVWVSQREKWKGHPATDHSILFVCF